MPYIKQEDRKAIDAGADPANPGELNYKFCMMNLAGAPKEQYISVARHYVEQKGLKYQTLNDVIGAFSGAIQEMLWRNQQVHTDIYDANKLFYAGHVAPYEWEKIQENGDIFTKPSSFTNV